MYACIYMRVCVYTHVTTIVTLFLTRTRLRSKHRIKQSLFAFHRYPASLSLWPPSQHAPFKIGPRRTDGRTTDQKVLQAPSGICGD